MPLFSGSKSQGRDQAHLELGLSVSASSMFGLLFGFEDGDVLLRNVDPSLNYTALQLKGQYSVHCYVHKNTSPPPLVPIMSQTKPVHGVSE
jgi:hypothetical protein